MLRMEWFAKNYLEENKSAAVLDVGSYDVNGNYKEIFTSRGHRYVGLDMEEGPNVDIVPKQIYNWHEIDNDSYDVVVSGQALEHIEFFWITVSEMTRVTKKGGLICIIAPNGFEEHRYPVDCWRFFTDGMIAMARFYKLEVIHAHTNCSPKPGNKEWYSENCADTMIVIRKTYSGETKVIDLENYRCIPEEHKTIREEMITHQEFKEEVQSKIERDTNKEYEAEKREKELEGKNRSGKKPIKIVITIIEMIRSSLNSKGS